MSLIQDALKRREQESGQPVHFPDSPDLPPRSAPTTRGYILPRQGKSAPWQVWVGIVVSGCILLVFLGVGVGFLFIAARSLTDKPRSPQSDAKPPVAVSQEPERTPEQPATPTNAQEAAKAGEINDTPHIGAGLPKGNRIKSIQFSPSGWPQLEITGVMMRPVSADCSVVIDGALLLPGDRIAEVEVVEIRPSGVLLEYRGERQFVKVGRPIL